MSDYKVFNLAHRHRVEEIHESGDSIGVALLKLEFKYNPSVIGFNSICLPEANIANMEAEYAMNAWLRVWGHLTTFNVGYKLLVQPSTEFYPAPDNMVMTKSIDGQRMHWVS